MSKVTLQTIAEAAGLSKFAVSRALSGKSGVSDETREQIIKLANEMGYKRNIVRSRPTIAVLCEDAELINGELNQKIMTGIRDEAHRLEYDLIELQTTGAKQLSDVTDRIDAMVFVGVNRPDMYKAAAAMNVPLVKIGTFDPLEKVDIVRGTNYEVGRVVGEMLLQRGHTHLVFVRGRRDFRGRQERFNGFYTAALPISGTQVTDLRWSSEKGLDKKLDTLLSGPDRATAFFCAHDGLAVTIMSELMNRNIRIPADASVVGYGDYMAAQHVRPPLTTVNVPGFAFGREAVRLLRERLTNPSDNHYALRVQIPSEIVIRDTLGTSPKSAFSANMIRISEKNT